MTLQQLRYVITVAQKGSISEAAKELFISQAQVSRIERKALNNLHNYLK